MNGGIITARYGKAFFEFVESRGASDAVFEQVRIILSTFAKVPQLREVFADPRRTSLQQKTDLVRATVDPAVLCPEIERLIALMDANGRIPYFRMTLLSFLELYRDSHNLVMVQITYAKKLEKLIPMITESAKRNSGLTPIFLEKENPDLIGGYIIETWDWRFDASIKGALERARKQLVQKTKRIV